MFSFDSIIIMKAIENKIVNFLFFSALTLIVTFLTLTDYLITTWAPYYSPITVSVSLSSMEIIKPLNLSIQLTTTQDDACKSVAFTTSLSYECHKVKKTPRDQIYQYDFALH
jgi:hypothetical protein